MQIKKKKFQIDVKVSLKSVRQRIGERMLYHAEALGDNEKEMARIAILGVDEKMVEGMTCNAIAELVGILGSRVEDVGITSATLTLRLQLPARIQEKREVINHMLPMMIEEWLCIRCEDTWLGLHHLERDGTLTDISTERLLQLLTPRPIASPRQ